MDRWQGLRFHSLPPELRTISHFISFKRHHNSVAMVFNYRNIYLTAAFLCNTVIIIAGPRETRNPNLDSDQRIAYYACASCL